MLRLGLRRVGVLVRHCSSSCPYEVLGVPPTASHAEVRASYLEQARATHPDVAPAGESPGSSRSFAELSAAYQKLSGDREAYDRSRVDQADSERALAATVDALVGAGNCREALAEFGNAPWVPHAESRQKLVYSARTLLKGCATGAIPFAHAVATWRWLLAQKEVDADACDAWFSICMRAGHTQQAQWPLLCTTPPVRIDSC